MGCAFDGGEMVSTGQQVNEWTARECETRRIGETRSQKQNKVNANDNVWALAA